MNLNKKAGNQNWKLLHKQFNFNIDEDAIYDNIKEDDPEELLIIDDELRQTITEFNCGFTTTVNNETIGRRLMDLTYDWKEASKPYPKVEKVLTFFENYKNEPLTIPYEVKVKMRFSVEPQKI